MTTTPVHPVHTTLAEPTPWLETFPVAPPAPAAPEPQKPQTRTLSREEREPTFENIAYGLHQCEEASIPLTVGTLQGMGACSQRFERILNYVSRTGETFHVTHETIDGDKLDEKDVAWFIEQLGDGFAIWGNSDEARDGMVMIANATGAPLDFDATFVKFGDNRSHRKSIAQYYDLLVDPDADSTYPSRAGTLTAYQNREDACVRAEERGLLFLHALVEFIHHGFWELNEGSSCTCYDEGVSFRVEMQIDCPCGQEDTVSLNSRELSRGYIDWECGECTCSHTVYFN